MLPPGRGVCGNPIIGVGGRGVGGRGVRGGGPGEEIDPADIMEGAPIRILVGVGAVEGLEEPEGTRYRVISFEGVYPLVPRIGFGPGGSGEEGDGV